MNNRSGHIDEIDVMRGIGIFFVVVGHVFPAGSSVHGFIYSFHMPLFFIISGMTLSINRDDQIFKRSDLRLVKEYFFYSALYLFFDFIVRLQVLKTYDINDIITDLQNTISLFGISVLWFIPAMIGARVLARLILSKTKLILQIGLCLVFICIGIYVPYHDKQTLITKIILVAQRIFVASSYVMVGFLLRKYIINIFEYRILLIFVGVPNVLLTYIVNGIDFRTLSWGEHTILAIILSLTGTMMVLGIADLFSHISKLKNLFIYLSGQSLKIMVFHSYLMLPGIIDVVLRRMILIPNFLYHTIKTVLLITIVIIICLTTDGTKKYWKSRIKYASK